MSGVLLYLIGRQVWWLKAPLLGNFKQLALLSHRKQFHISGLNCKHFNNIRRRWRWPFLVINDWYLKCVYKLHFSIKCTYGAPENRPRSKLWYHCCSLWWKFSVMQGKGPTWQNYWQISQLCRASWCYQVFLFIQLMHN